MIWAEIFKLHHFYAGTHRSISRVSRFQPRRFNISSIYSHEDNPWSQNLPLVAKTWKEFCNEHLPDPEHAKLRGRLLRLEDTCGPMMRKRFPPGVGCVAAKEEQAGRPSVSPVTLLSLGIHRDGQIADYSTSDIIICFFFLF